MFDKHMGDFDKPNYNKTLVNAQQLNQAEANVSQLSKAATHAIKLMASLSVDHQRSIASKIHHFTQRAIITFQHATYLIQIKTELHNFDFKIHKIVIMESFRNVAHLILSVINRAILEPRQRKSAISSVHNIVRYTQKRLTEAPRLSQVKAIFTEGVNATNGALSGYIADSRMYIIQQLKNRANALRKNVSQQKHLDIMAKYLAYQQIDSIWTGITANLMTTTSFVTLAAIKERNFQRLNDIQKDRHHVLHDFTAFINFGKQAEVKIAKLAGFSDDLKSQLQYRIDHYQRVIFGNLQNHHKLVHNVNLLTNERHMANYLVANVFQGYHQQIKSHLDHGSDWIYHQKVALINQLRRADQRLTAQIKKNKKFSLVKQSLFNGLDTLEKIANQIHIIVFRNQVTDLVHNLKSRFMASSTLTERDKKRLAFQLKVISKRLMSQRASLDVSSVKDQLQELMHKQVTHLKQTSIRKQVNDLNQQINLSMLPSSQRQFLLRRLKRIWGNKALGINHKTLLIHRLVNHGLDLDKDYSLKRLTKLNTVIPQNIKSIDASAQLSQALGKDFIRFSHRINNVTQISRMDHIEQKFEDHAYQRFYRLIMELKPSIQPTVKRSLDQAKQARQQINLSILQPRLRQVFNDDVTRSVDEAIYKAVMINSRALKQSTSAKSVIKAELKQILAKTKFEYIKRFKAIIDSNENLLVAYSSSERMIGQSRAIASRFTSQIKNAKNLLAVERSKQIGIQAINDFADRIISQNDERKGHAHAKIYQMSKRVQKSLKYGSSIPKLVKLSALNQTLQATNQANYRINQDLADDLAGDQQKCQQKLSQILRLRYVREWQMIINAAYAKIHGLARVPINVRINALRSIQQIEDQTLIALNSRQNDQLSKVLRTRTAKVRQVVRKSMYQDPAKRKIYVQLKQTVNQNRIYLQHYTNGKVQTKVLDRLNHLAKDLKARLDSSHYQDMPKICHQGCQNLNILAQKAVRKAQFKRFDDYEHRMEKRFAGLRLLADKERHQFRRRFNVNYHKSEYQIGHAKDVTNCVNSERSGETILRSVIQRADVINQRKQRIYQGIQSEIKRDRSRIKHLKYLRPKDKQDGRKLLAEIRQNGRQSVYKALSGSALTVAKRKNHATIKQIMNKIESANVLIAAIRTANDQISHSSLDTQEKQLDLKRIHRIISNGIQNQLKKSQKSNQKGTSNKAQKSSSNKSASISKKVLKWPFNLICWFVGMIGVFFSWFVGIFK